jgi:hypothetical protein
MLTLFITGCSKADNKPLEDGIYKGIFYRTNPWTDTAQVTLIISGNRFTGQSNKANYPALCNGKFSVNGDKIRFENNCPWTANFDWNFILNNDFEIKGNGRTIEISRGYNGIIFYKDVYQLTKQ